MSSAPLESASASDLVEYTYEALYRHLSQQEPTDISHLLRSLIFRAPKLKQPASPFPGPSSTSKAAIDGGTITLDDGVRLRVRDSDKEHITILSAKLNLDEVEAFVIFRSYLYYTDSREVPVDEEKGDDIEPDDANDEDPLISAVIEFYFRERLFVLRIYEPLFRAQGDESHPFHDMASDALSTLVHDRSLFISTLITELVHRSNAEVPPAFSQSPHQTSLWTKQVLKEQLCILEVIFWATYDINAQGPIVVQFYEALYSTSLGRVNKLESFLLDPESTQLFADLESLFIITSVEILNLESLVNKEERLDLELVTVNRHGYLASPQHIDQIHTLVLTTPSEPRFSPVILAWASILNRITDAAGGAEYPAEYATFLKRICPPPVEGHVHHQAVVSEPVWQTFSRVALSSQMCLLETLIALLEMPILSESAAAKLSSSITSPDDLFFRSTMKMLVLCLTELISIEFIPSLPTFLTLWVSLFSNAPTTVVSVLTAEFWQRDFQVASPSRRALLEITRDRFPVQLTPFVKVMRSMSGMGLSELSDLEGFLKERLADVGSDRLGSAAMVFEYVSDLETYCQVISSDALAVRSHYEHRIDPTGVPLYYNLRPVRLPGGSTLPSRAEGRVLTQSESGGPVVIMWAHKHNGWKLLLAVMREYVRRKRVVRGRGKVGDADGSNTPSRNKVQSLNIEALGIEHSLEDPDLVAQILDLFRSIFHNNPTVRNALIQGLEDEDTAVSSPDLIQTCLSILGDALSTVSRSTTFANRLVTNVLGVLATLLPSVSNIWNFLHSSPLLLGESWQKGSIPVLLATERATGQYNMTLALLDFVRALFDESCRMALRKSDPTSTSPITTTILLNALIFVHNDVWVEHAGWKYTDVAERFNVGRKIASLYAEILTRAPAVIGATSERPANRTTLSILAKFVLNNFITEATSGSINPLVLSIGTGYQLLDVFYKVRRWADGQRLAQLLQTEFRFIRLLLLRKRTISSADKISLLEQNLFRGGAFSALSLDRRRSRTNPIDTLSQLIKHRNEMGLQLESIRLFSALSYSVAGCQPSPPSLLGHIVSPEEFASYAIWTIQQQSEDLSLKIALWNLITAVVDTQPPLAILFVTGKVQVIDGMDLENEADKNQNKREAKDSEWPEKDNALDVAHDVLSQWKVHWEESPETLSSSLGFLDVVWQHASEHLRSLQPFRSNKQFWIHLSEIVEEDIGPAPGTVVEDMIESNGEERSILHEQVAGHAYRTVAKAHAIHVFALDLSMDPSAKQATISFDPLLDMFKSNERLQKRLDEAIQTSFSPQLHTDAHQSLEDSFPALSLDDMRSQNLPFEREYGDDYLFPGHVVRERLSDYVTGSPSSRDKQEPVFRLLTSLNLNWSLTDSQIALTKSWKRLIQSSSSLLLKDNLVLRGASDAAIEVARSIYGETRPGEVMTAVHLERLGLLQELLEIVWLSPVSVDAVGSFSMYINAIVLSETFPPLESLRGLLSVRFHRSVLQITYYCIRMALPYVRDPKRISAELRPTVTMAMSTYLGFSIEAMRIAFDSAREGLDTELDKDLELIVAIFEQCTRPSIHPNPSFWLSLCQGSDLIKASLSLLGRVDISGNVYPDVVRLHKQPLYAQHILRFHLALSSVPAAAERLAHDAVMVSYSQNELTPYLEAGVVDPGQESHESWSIMLQVVTNLVATLNSRGGHFVSSEVIGFVQLYGPQLSRVLSWNANDPLSLALLDEMGIVVGLFHSIAAAEPRTETTYVTDVVLRGYAEKAQILLQQLNHSLSHPNSLATILEAATPEERKFFEAQVKKPVQESLDVIDGSKHPLMASLVQRILGVIFAILSTLVIVSKADDILSHVEPVGPLGPPLLSARANVNLSEPASVGTLLELGNWTFNVVNHLYKNSKASRVVLPPGISLIPFDPRVTLELARRTVETLMVYGTTQLFLTLRAGTANEPTTSMDVDPGDRRERRRSTISVLERLKGEVQDLAMDLNMLAGRAREVFGKTFADDGGSALILVQVLIGFGSARLIRTDSYR